MTGLESNLEALAEKEYRQDEANLRHYEKMVEYWYVKMKDAEGYKDFYTDKILEIHRKRVQRNQEEQ